MTPARPEAIDTGAGAGSIQKAIATNYDQLTPGQRKAIDRLLTDTRYAAITSAPELAAEVGVSESTITRAAQALGFSGYPDLQARLRDEFIGSVQERMSQFSGLGDTPAAAAVRVMLEDAETIRMTAEDLPFDTLIAATDILIAARKVYIFGPRGSYGLALILGIGLRLLLPGATVLSQTAGDLEDQLLDMTQEDALVAISFRRLDRIMVQVVRHASTVGAQTVVISDQISSPASRLAAVTLVARAGPLRLMPSFAAAASLVNALIVAVSLCVVDQATDRLELAERIWRDFNTYVEG